MYPTKKSSAPKPKTAKSTASSNAKKKKKVSTIESYCDVVLEFT